MRRALTILGIVLAPWLVIPWLVVRWLLRGEELARWDDRQVERMKPASEVSDEHLRVVADLERDLAGLDEGSRVTRLRRSRLWMEDLGADVRTEATITPVDAPGVRGEWVVPPGADTTRRLLYLHGGAFQLGSPRSHRRMTTKIAERTGVSLLVLQYRLMPEHARRSSVEDARAAWRWMLANGPAGAAAAGDVYVAGDSAGANLALALTHWARDTAHRTPDATVVFSPPVDNTFSSPSWRDNIDTDPFLGPSLGSLMRLPRALLVVGTWLTNRIRPDDPRVSPLLDDLSELPPTLVQASDAEMVFDDAVRYANKAGAVGSPGELQVWPRMVHVFQAFEDLPEAEQALDEVAAFIDRHRSVPVGDQQLDTA